MTGAAVVGRRERKKQRTREELISAAFELFQEKGFRATTVEEIADAVDVSPRTFFRYFTSKEDVVVASQQEAFGTFMQAFTDRPVDEPVMTAIRRSAVRVVRATETGELDDLKELAIDPIRFACTLQMMGEDSKVLGHTLEDNLKKQVHLAEVIGARMGVDVETDMRPLVVASAVTSAFSTAFGLIANDESNDRSLADLLDHVFAIFEDGLNFPSNAATS